MSTKAQLIREVKKHLHHGTNPSTLNHLSAQILRELAEHLRSGTLAQDSLMDISQVEVAREIRRLHNTISAGDYEAALDLSARLLRRVEIGGGML